MHSCRNTNGSEFTALLVYDARSREAYHEKLKAMLHDAHAHLEEVDASPGAETVAETFDKLVPRADVILVDVTHHNTNVGIEIGRHMLHRDPRLIPFHCDCEPFSPAKLPFYLRAYPCSRLDPKKKTSFPANHEFLTRILAVGHRKALSPLERFQTGPTSDEEALREFHEYSTVLKSPAAAFFFGEFAVTVGHPALYLPLPLHVAGGMRELGRNEPTQVKYKQGPHAAKPWVELDWHYRAKLQEALKLLGRKVPPLEIAVWSQAPTMCGLGTSSAIAACLACYLHREGMIRQGTTTIPSDIPPNMNLLGPSGILNDLFRTAWKIDLCFHSLKGSGAGAFATLCGTHGPNPVHFLSAARKIWENDIGSHGWELGTTLKSAYEAIDSLPCWGFRLAPPPPKIAFKPTHFALVFTGETKMTGHAMDKLETMSNYFLESPRMVRQIVESIRNLPAQVRHEIQSRISDAYFKLIDDSLTGAARDEDLSRKHSALSQETLFTAYGTASMLGMNSYWSKNDFSYLALMETCQSLLEVLGVTGITPDGGATTWEPYALAQHLNCTPAADKSRIFGAKITGGGMGGDLLVASSLTDPDEFERTLRHALLRAKDAFRSQYGPEFAKVHFSSTWLPEYPAGYECRGTHFLR